VSAIQAVAAGVNITDTFSYEIADGLGVTDRATATISITGVNDPPVSVNDSYAANEDAVLSVSARGVLQNDTDAEPDTQLLLQVGQVNGSAANVGSVVTLSSGARLTMLTDGSFTYDPRPSTALQGLAAGATFVDTFSYRANDGLANSTADATVSITVTGVNDAPTAVGDALSTSEDVLLVVAAPGLLSNDTDPDGDRLTANAFSGASSRGASVTIAADGGIEYDPRLSAELQALRPGQTLVDTVTYSISDGKGGVSNATVSITVAGANDAPIARNDEYRVDEDSRLVVSGRGVLENDTDVDAGDSLVVATYNVTSALGAPVLVNSDGTFTYDPTAVPAVQALGPGQTLRDTFRYAVSDGTSQSNEAVVSVTVEGRNDAPIPQNDQYTVVEEGQLIVSIAQGVLSNDTDPEGSPLNATRVSGPSNGTLAFNSAGSFTYRPNENFAGTDTFVYRASDGAAGTNATVTISVTNVNDAPVAVADQYEVAQDNALSVNATNGLLRNDTDVDQEVLRVERITGSGPNNGTLTLFNDGSFTYQPRSGFVGQDVFQYRAIDGIGVASPPVTVTINVTNTRAWRNPTLALDVNGDGSVSPIDVLLIVNYLNQNGAGPVPVPTPPPPPYRDTNGDNNVTPADALLVINFLNNQGLAEGEGESLESNSDAVGGLFAGPSTAMILPCLDDQHWTTGVWNDRPAEQRPVSSARDDLNATEVALEVIDRETRLDGGHSGSTSCWDPSSDFEDVLEELLIGDSAGDSQDDAIGELFGG
jgi:VCBS repeat-containing protein